MALCVWNMRRIKKTLGDKGDTVEGAGDTMEGGRGRKLKMHELTSLYRPTRSSRRRNHTRVWLLQDIKNSLANAFSNAQKLHFDGSMEAYFEFMRFQIFP